MSNNILVDQYVDDIIGCVHNIRDIEQQCSEALKYNNWDLYHKYIELRREQNERIELLKEKISALIVGSPI